MSFLKRYMTRNGKSYKLCYFSQNKIRQLSLSHSRFTKTHYQTLNLPNGATQSDIKNAYYDLSMKYHPDKADVGSIEKFRDITTAYEVLGNPRLRSLYDRGLLSDDPDASIHYPTESSWSGAGGISEEDQQRTKEQVKTFDAWSQDHITDTFSRSQYEKEISKKKDATRRMASTASSEVWVFIVILLIITLIISYVPTDPSRNRKDSKSNNDKKKS